MAFVRHSLCSLLLCFISLWHAYLSYTKHNAAIKEEQSWFSLGDFDKGVLSSFSLFHPRSFQSISR